MPAAIPVTVNGMTYPSKLAACQAYGHAGAKIDHRVRTGMSFEDAINAKPRYTGAKAHSSYVVWNAMISRCTSKGNGGYKTHGARGISVCERWLKDFWAFVADMGERPSLDHSLDRFPNQKGNYEPNNCRWATQEQQSRNKYTNVFIEFKGERLCLRDWAKRVGVSPDTLKYRIRNGWPLLQALSLSRLPHGATYQRIAAEQRAGA